jgi:hypothetical protein
LGSSSTIRTSRGTCRPRAAPCEGDDLRLVGARPGLEGDEGEDLLAQLRVGPADDGGLGDGGVLVQHLLDLARVDVVAAADDEVLLAVDDEQVAVLVGVAEVAGVEPAVLERLGRRLGLL